MAMLTLGRRGDDRRQPLLKEAQVARLYGEDTFRDIVRQSQTMPLPTPLALGCGYAHAGDWQPARRPLPGGTPKADRLRELLALPFAGYTALAELRRAVAESERLRLLRLSAAVSLASLYGFSSLSALINEATVNGKRDSNNWWQKTLNPTTAAGAAYWTWMWGGYPSAGVIPAAGVALTATSAATAGAFGQANAPASNTKHLTAATATSTVAAGALLICDQTCLVQPVLATTTQQVITGSPTRYQSNGNNGVLPFLFNGSVANTTTPVLAFTYTESTAGTTARTGVPGTAQASATIYRTQLAGGNIFAPLQAGDVGVRRIESTTWSTAPAQATAWGLAYPYCFVPIGAANAIFGTDLINTQFNLVQVIDGACIAFILMAATTSAGILQGELMLVSGNS